MFGMFPSRRVQGTAPEHPLSQQQLAPGKRFLFQPELLPLAPFSLHRCLSQRLASSVSTALHLCKPHSQSLAPFVPTASVLSTTFALQRLLLSSLPAGSAFFHCLHVLVYEALHFLSRP